MRAAAGAALSLAAPGIVRAERLSTLTYVPTNDLASLDPVNLAPGSTNVHAVAVFETLFALNGSLTAVPHMLEGFTVERDGLEWRLRLRPGLRFHDGEPVRARDVVASLRRWAPRDVIGTLLFSQTDELIAASDRDVIFRLRRPFPMLPHALGKPEYYGAFIMPERLAAATDALHPVPEIIGSGPYRYIASERVVGERAVYERFAGYIPRDEPPDVLSGARIAGFDRVVWKFIPDPATSAAALANGEVDWWDTPTSDLLPLLRANPKLDVVVRARPGGLVAWSFNCNTAPFDNPAVRRAVLTAVDQATYLQAAFGDDRRLWRDKVGIWEEGTAIDTDAGVEAMRGDIAQARQELARAGYGGELVVVLRVADSPVVNACAEVATDMLKRMGMNAVLQTMDYGTMVKRRASNAPSDKGGWSVFFTSFISYSTATPPTHGLLGGFFGEPALPEIAALRARWTYEEDPAARKDIARQIQMLVWRDVPYIPLGRYYAPTAFNRSLVGSFGTGADFVNVRRA